MKTKMAKIKEIEKLLLNPAKPRKLRIVLKRNEAGEAYVDRTDLLNAGTLVNIVQRIIDSTEDIDYFKTFNCKALVDEQIKIHKLQSGDGRFMQMDCQSIEAADLITEMYNRKI